jgi:hypothetical protein
MVAGLVLFPQLIFVGVISILLYHRVGRWSPWYVSAPTLLGWFLTFSCVFLVPDDVISTAIRNDVEPCISPSPSPYPSPYPSPSSHSPLSPSPPSPIEEEECGVPASVVPFEVMIIIWATLYWFMFIACWVVYPLLISYVDKAEFHFHERMYESVHDNVVMYM